MAGELSVSTAPDLMKAIEDMPQDICNIDIDMSEIDYISSAGLRILFKAANITEDRNGTMRAIQPNEDILEVFEMTGVNEVLEVVR